VAAFNPMSLLSKGVSAIGSSIVSGVKSLASGVSNIFTGGSKPTTPSTPIPISRYLPAANQAPKTGPIGNYAMSTGQVNKPVTVNISTQKVASTVTASTIARAVASTADIARRGR
jgi:hypothetical protein